MTANIFIPRALPLLSDSSLIATVQEYRGVLSLLGRLTWPAVIDVKHQILQALDVYEDELRARGLTPVAGQEVVA
jgi:hypothetical protein